MGCPRLYNHRPVVTVLNHMRKPTMLQPSCLCGSVHYWNTTLLCLCIDAFSFLYFTLFKKTVSFSIAYSSLVTFKFRVAPTAGCFHFYFVFSKSNYSESISLHS